MGALITNSVSIGCVVCGVIAQKICFVYMEPVPMGNSVWVALFVLHEGVVVLKSFRLLV